MKYIIVSENSNFSSMFKIMFNDVFRQNKGVFISNTFDEHNKLKQILFKLLYKRKINKYLKSRFEILFKPKFNLINEIKKLSPEPITIIFNNSGIDKYYNKYTLKKIKNEYSRIKFVLYFVDPIFQCKNSDAVKLISTGIFDLIYTYSKFDAKNYNFLYYPTPYSKVINVPKKLIKGVYFCGAEKGRTNLLNSVCDKLVELNIPYHFYVEGNPNNSSKYFKVIDGHGKKYNEVIRNTVKYSCILDLIQENKNKLQSGLSLRPYEALVYGKALITNNPNIKRFEYYNPKTMHYIKTASDIKKEWIVNKVENNYHGQFSPLNFVKDIEKRLEL